MTRQTVNGGGWFDADKARKWGEHTRWDGHNRISANTGLQWSHQELYRTTSGRWILCCWSQWMGTLPSYSQITAGEAAAWLVRNEHDVPEELLQHVQAAEL